MKPSAQMPRQVRLIFSRATAKPYLGAVGFGNAMIESYFQKRDFEISTQHMITHSSTPVDPFMPFRQCRANHAVQSSGPADLAVYDDFGLYLCLPNESVAWQIVVFFHCLAGGSAVWTGPMNQRIRSYWANSAYLADVLRSVLALPSHDPMRCAHPSPFEVVRTVRLPVTDRESLRADAEPHELPASIAAALDSGNVIGHAVQPGKANLDAVCAILLHLNVIAKEHGQSGCCRLVLFEDDLENIRASLHTAAPDEESERARLQLRGLLDGLHLSLDDIFIGVPWLPQAVLFQLMRRAKFCLSYNKYPEALGFYLMESILHGCPVFTNGCGNNRFLLPPDCGIDVYETAEMHFGDLAAYRQVAERIFDEIHSARARANCVKGAEYLRREYCEASFASDLDACLQSLDGPAPAAVDARSLRVTWSPMVRLWDQPTSRIVSDYVSTTLPASAPALLSEIVGMPWGDALRSMAHRRSELDELFFTGILALAPEHVA